MAHVCRELQPLEFELIDWMLKDACAHPDQYLEQLRAARVCGQCDCGCAGINLKIHHHEPDWSSGLQVLAEYLWRDGAGCLMGVSVYAHHHQLAGLEVWSVDGATLPRGLPRPDQLMPFQQVCSA